MLVLGTDQRPPHPLDMLPTARTLAGVLTAIAAADESFPARRATALAVPGLTENAVVGPLIEHLGEAPPYRQALVTWGSGSTAMVMGVLTALSRVGLPWQLVLTSGPAGYQVVDPLERLDVDPVAGVFVRWRMFAALDELAAEDPPVIRLTEDQRAMVRQAARHHRDGLSARDCASLRAVLADAVVRRDGSASLAVRRYVTSRYEELLAIDKKTHPQAEDLLCKYERPEGGPSLGVKRGKIERAARNEPVSAWTGLPSYRWLFSPEANALQNIGKGSHNLRPPAPHDSKLIGDYLSGYEIDDTGWREAGLPEPPVTPADTVLAVWFAGLSDDRAVGTVGQQLSRRLPAVVVEHLGVEKTRMRAVIVAVDDGQGSLGHAEADAGRIGRGTDGATGGPEGEAWVEPVEISDIDPAVVERAVERAVERRVTRETGALLVVPTGYKPAMFPLLRAVRRVGARHGLPLFVREMAQNPEKQGEYEVYLWPALTGGDLPLLDAARGALRALELDVAWRLLAASAIDRSVTDQARQLADTFASREPLASLAPISDHASWTTGLIVQRLEVVEAALAYAEEPADRIRLLVLAADALEASIAAAPTIGELEAKYRPLGGKYRKFRDGWSKEARRQGGPEAASARILLLLNRARDRAPITHGTGTDPDAVVADAADRLVAKWELSPADAATLPANVATLLRSAVTAAASRGLGQPDRPDSLLRLHEQLMKDVERAVVHRRTRSQVPHLIP